MATPLQLFTLFSLFCLAALANPLLTVLQREGFTEFARLLEESDGEVVRNACTNRMIIFAPTNSAVDEARSCSKSLTRRGTLKNTTQPNPDQHCCAQPTVRNGRRRAEVTTGPGAVSLMNLLSDPEFVNLGPGQNSSVVQKNVPNAALGVVLSGLGESVKITGLDIPYDCGVIRPISGSVF